MGSVSQQYSGTASGINNAITRISNVLANAIFGALAVMLFSMALQARLRDADLSGTSRQAVMAQAVNLGNAAVPKEIDNTAKEKIERYYHESFIEAYKKIMLISAGLAFIGACMSLLFIQNKTAHQPDKP
ncbi:MFS transporter [Parachryseolinea silvisoli]|uniref:hypothetical protein n=1 Tax=Parachryseolinea silvisoli TaxID=2873601 RepID=UPI002265E0D7|nr:hypothetical protein [Parachryseolinea silvisoli]MCD9017560.1 hypothetical protein [Parachryseolinea silvisoli]